jgi:hypothetical protein
MPFWVTASLRYLLVACGAFLLSIALSFLSVLPWDDPGTPAVGMLWGLVLWAEACLIIPVSLAITAELLDRQVHARKFRWSKALVRILLALPIGLAPFYANWGVAIYVANRRPPHWVLKEAALYIISALFACFALRIKTPQGVARPSQQALVR